jgi:hypothetical protein
VQLEKEKDQGNASANKTSHKGLFYIDMKQISDFSILKHNVFGHRWSRGTEFC